MSVSLSFNIVSSVNLRCFCGRVPWLYQYWPGGFMVFVVLCPGTPEGSTGSGSGLKRLRRRDNGLKSHPTDWEKPGIEPATPGLQDIGLSPTPRRLLFCGCVPWLYLYWPGGFMVLWFYVQELPKAQPAVVLVLKRLRRRVNSLKPHPTDWENITLESHKKV